MDLTTLHSECDLWGPETWVAPLSLAEFAAMHWCRAPLAITGPERRGARLLARIADAAGPAQLPANEAGTATVRMVKAGRLVTLTMLRADAEKLLKAGETVNVFEPECIVPLKRAFASVLHLAADRVESNLFFSKPGGVTLTHFDASDSIVVQLRGTKRWRLAHNALAPDPLEHSGIGAEPHASLRLHAHGEWPRVPPEGETEFVAGPGSVLYIPRGVWHATETCDDSLSAHFHYKTAAWVEVLWPVLYRELVRDPEWRASAWGESGLADDAATEAKVARLLARATGSFAAITAEDVLRRKRKGVARGPGTPYRRRAGIGVGVEGTEEDGDKKVRTVAPEATGEHVTYCAVAPELLPLVEWIVAREPWDRFNALDVPRPESADVEDVTELLAVLEEGGVVAPA